MIVLAACGRGAVSFTEWGTTGTEYGCDEVGDLDLVRGATEAYVDPAVAEADGYTPQAACDEDPDGAAMGIHYVRLPTSLDQEIDLESPDVLLYLPDGQDLRLVGIEYVRPALVDGSIAYDPPSDPTAFDEPPSLFCRQFDGPMEGHVPGQPWHYDLHVWLYADNPEGLYAAYNPAESCGT